MTCDRGCSGEARDAVGRIVRIDPSDGRTVRSTRVPRPMAIAVGTRAVYSLDFWRNRIALLDPRTLRVVRSLKLKLPFRFTSRDNAFRPLSVAAGRSAVWVATARGALARADVELRRVRATVRLPFDNPAALAVAPHSVWLPEGLAGVYRVDSRTNRVVARLKVSLPHDRFDAERITVCAGKVLVLGAAVRAALTNREYLFVSVITAEFSAASPGSLLRSRAARGRFGSDGRASRLSSASNRAPARSSRGATRGLVPPSPSRAATSGRRLPTGPCVSWAGSRAPQRARAARKRGAPG